MRIALVVVVGAALCGCGVVSQSSVGKADTAAPEVFEGPVERANCGAGSDPEPDIQGRVPAEDVTSGRALKPYTCNLEQVGQVGDGTSWQLAWYEDCAYYGTHFQSAAGVQVVDAKDRSKPVISATLTTPAMLDPWESLKVNDKRGLLGGDAGWNVAGPFFFDVYDVSKDCAHPAMLATLPVDIPVGHEGNWAPDGQTYYSGFNPAAIDVSDPTKPLYIPRSDDNGSGHGLSVSDDGNRMYAVNPLTMNGAHCATSEGSNGLAILDVSQIQSRKPLPASPLVGGVCWSDGSTAQHTIPIDIGGHPYLVFVDEGSEGMARIIDLADEKNPVVISKLKLEIDMPDAAAQRTADGAGSPESGTTFTYQGHYCGVDREHDATALACSYFWSGVRVFDIRDPRKPKEIAYFNPGGVASAASTSQAGCSGNTRACSSAQVRFIRETGELWFTDQMHGLYLAKFTNGAWPFK